MSEPFWFRSWPLRHNGSAGAGHNACPALHKPGRTLWGYPVIIPIIVPNGLYDPPPRYRRRRYPCWEAGQVTLWGGPLPDQRDPGGAVRSWPTWRPSVAAGALSHPKLARNLWELADDPSRLHLVVLRPRLHRWCRFFGLGHACPAPPRGTSITRCWGGTVLPRDHAKDQVRTKSFAC